MAGRSIVFVKTRNDAKAPITAGGRFASSYSSTFAHRRTLEIRDVSGKPLYAARVSDITGYRLPGPGGHPGGEIRGQVCK